MIKNPKYYQTKVPIHRYEDLNQDWWSRTHLKDEQHVFWNEPIKYFALSSGTSKGATKYLPVSKSAISSMSKITMRMISQIHEIINHSSELTSQVLWLGGSSNLNEDNGIFTGDISGINAKFRPSYLSKVFKPEKDISNILSWEKRLELIIERARQWDIGILCGIPSWVTLLLEKIIERYQLNCILDIWPNLRVYVSGGIHFEPYKENFFNLVGKNISVRDTYLASEGFFAYQYGDQDDLRMKLNLKDYFFEGIPYVHESSLKQTESTVPCYEFELNKKYALVITNKSGAWRYLIGDIIEVVNKEQMAIKLVGRTSESLSMAGEHLTGLELIKAIEILSKTFDLNARQFVILPTIRGNCVYHHWYVSSRAKSPAELMADSIDTTLKVNNYDYKSVRDSGVLSGPKVTIVEDDAFNNWLKNLGKYGNQNKLPMILNALQSRQWKEFISENEM